MLPDRFTLTLSCIAISFQTPIFQFKTYGLSHFEGKSSLSILILLFIRVKSQTNILLVRRLVTMLPAVLVAAIGLNPISTLMISQVVFGFALPLPIITLIMFTRRRDLMESLVNKSLTTWTAIACSVVILGMNIWLLYSTFASFFGWWLPS